jgi:DNA polymerase-3 subunit beta
LSTAFLRERIELELVVRTQTLTSALRFLRSQSEGIDAAKFPIIPTIDSVVHNNSSSLEALRIELGSTGLRKMVDQVVFAASTDESRPTLTGVEVTFKEGRLTMAATDGYRLSVRSAAVDGSLPSTAATVIVPARSLSELARISADADEGRTVGPGDPGTQPDSFQIWGRSSEGKGGTFTASSWPAQLIDANFPDYRAIIPKTHTTAHCCRHCRPAQGSTSRLSICSRQRQHRSAQNSACQRHPQRSAQPAATSSDIATAPTIWPHGSRETSWKFLSTPSI